MLSDFIATEEQHSIGLNKVDWKSFISFNLEAVQGNNHEGFKYLNLDIQDAEWFEPNKLSLNILVSP